MLKDFKEFALKGNLIDMATGIIIGAAFGTVVKSLVSDVIMPPIGTLLGDIDFSSMHAVIKQGDPAGPYATLELAKEAGAVTMNWGMFLNNVISFVIVAFCVFLIIRVMNRLKKKEEAKPAAPPKQEVLLEEIRDLLKAK